MAKKKLPIGYWIRQADQLITDGIDKIQSQFGLTRSDWQILNSLFEHSPIEKKEMLAIMEPFLDSSSAVTIIEQLRDKEFISINVNLLSLTNKGKEQYTNCLEQQKEFRQTAMKDISQEDYQLTVQTLQSIVDNLKKPT